MNPILLDLGFVKIYWYSVTMLIAILVGSTLFYKEAIKRNLDDDFLTNLMFYAIIFGIVGARLYFVLFNLGYYLKNPIEIIAVWNGGLAIHGAIIGGGLWMIYYSIKNKVNPLKILDIAACTLLISQAIGRWGNFFNSEAHGIITTRAYLEKLFIPKFVIDGMYIEGNYYIPTFYYEFLWNVLGFIFINVLRKKVKLDIGKLTGIYFMWYSFARFFIEGVRTDSLMLGSIRVAQLISVILFVLGALLTFYPRKDTRVNRLKRKSDN